MDNGGEFSPELCSTMEEPSNESHVENKENFPPTASRVGFHDFSIQPSTAWRDFSK
jgi:hypothetical protein